MKYTEIDPGESFNGTQFEYNAEGVRTKKGNTEFILAGEKIVAEKKNGVITKRYFYDASGIAGMWFNGTNYTFRKNLQGDVVGICDGNGNLLGSYTYDAWGKILASGSATIFAENPFRYRGYYYDTETQLYYLQTRYYDPETGRFLNEDAYSYLEPETVNGLNLYAYCLNNPVMGVDPTGTWDWNKFWGWAVTAFIAIASVAAIAIVAAGVVASGGILGAVLVGAGAGALISMGTNIVGQGGFSNADPWAIAKAGGIGAAIGAISGAASWIGGTKGAELGQHFGYALSNTIHYGSGVTFGRCFGMPLLIRAGEIVGRTIAGFVAALFMNDVANEAFANRDLNPNEIFIEGVYSEAPLWLITFLRWMFV